MKLIDADKLKTNLWDSYCHYACNGLDLNKSADLNVAICAVEVQEEIEAIPIEWLEEYIEESIPRKEHLPYWYKRNWKNRLQMMIEDWRKENEID